MRIELIAEIDGQKIKGLSQMKALADKGNIEALNLLGEWMMMGFECSPDPDFCVSCFKEAAYKGNTQAMLNLAVCYMEGKGVNADFYAAKRWIWAGLDGGDVEAVGMFHKLYLTTIGNHKPDVHEYVDTIYELDPTGEALFELEGDRLGWLKSKILSPDEIKKRLYANIVFSARGKSVKEIRKLRNYLTEADIEGYARLQDIHHDDAEGSGARNYDAEVARTISDFQAFVPTADREQLLLAIRVLNKIKPSTTAKIIGTWTVDADDELFGGEEVTAISDELQSRIYNIAIRACKITKTRFQDVLNTLTTSLSWRTKATFDIDEGMFDKFHVDDVAKIINLVETKLDRIENGEIQAEYDKCSSDWRILLKLLTNIKATEYYGTDVIKNWSSAISARIAELQDQEITTTFARDKNKYLAMVSLVSLVKSKDIASSIKEKWLTQLQEVTISLQHTELESLCTNLAGKQLNELYQIEAKADKYDFDKKTLSTYKVQLTEAIEAAQNKYISDKFESAQNNYDSLVALHTETSGSRYYSVVATAWREKISAVISAVQQSELQTLLACTDSLGYAELIKLRQRAEHYSFDADVLSSALKPLDEIIDQKEKAHLDELCAGVEGYSVARLNVLEEKINALHYRESNTKKPLAQIRKLIKSNGLLEKCTPGRLANCEPDQLDSLMQEVHFSSLPKEEKERIFALIVKQREANENFEAELLQVVEDSKNELARFIKNEFSTLRDILCIYPDDSSMHSQIKHISREDWSDDETPLVYVKKGNRLDCLLTNKAIRGNESIVLLTDYEVLKICGESCNLVIQKKGNTTLMLAWGNSAAWDKAGAEKIALAFNRSIQKIKGESASRANRIRTIKNQHQNNSTLLSEAGSSAFAAFAQRYSPGSVAELTDEQIEASKDAVQESSLSSSEKKAILHVLNERAKWLQRTKDATDTYERNFLAASCNTIRGIAARYVTVPAMVYNDSYAYKRQLDSIKMNYKSSTLVDKVDFGALAEEGVCILMCGGKGSFVAFNRYTLLYYSAEDSHYGSGWANWPYKKISKLSYRKQGFTYAPEIRIHDVEDELRGLSVPGQSSEVVQQMAVMCDEIMKFLQKEIFTEKCNARSADISAISKYFEGLQKAMSMFCTELWESTILTNDTLAQAQFSEYLNKCIEFEADYYEKHPLKLSFDYYTIKKPSTFTSSRPKTEPQNKTVQAKPAEQIQPQTVQTKTDSATTSKKVLTKEEIERVVKRLVESGKKLEAVKYLREETGMGLAEAKSEAEKYEKPNNAPSTPAQPATVPPATTAASTQANSIDAFKEKGLTHLKKKISELTDAELYEAMLALALKHRPRSYLTVGTDAFNSKINKALAAYARVPAGEKILVMEDQTIFGSAKEGFVLTDKHIYINISGCKNKCVTISEITNVFNTRGTGLTDVMVSTPSGKYRLSYRSEIADGDACTAFLAELIQYLNSNCVANAPAAQTAVPPQAQAAAPVQPATPAPASVLKWQCGCGSINSGNFCAKCGGKKENGTPLWTCVCGSVNKGKFCTKCGSPKKEG